MSTQDDPFKYEGWDSDDEPTAPPTVGDAARQAIEAAITAADNARQAERMAELTRLTTGRTLVFRDESEDEGYSATCVGVSLRSKFVPVLRVEHRIADDMSSLRRALRNAETVQWLRSVPVEDGPAKERILPIHTMRLVGAATVGCVVHGGSGRDKFTGKLMSLPDADHVASVELDGRSGKFTTEVIIQQS